MKYRPLHSCTSFLIIVAEWQMSMNLDTKIMSEPRNHNLRHSVVSPYQFVYNVIKVKYLLSYYFQKQVNML